MAIVVLVFWLFTAGAGLYLLVTGNLGRVRSIPHAAGVAPAPDAAPASAATPPVPAPASVTAPAEPASAQAGSAQAGSAQAGSAQAGSAQAGSAETGSASDIPAWAAASPVRGASPASRREARAARDRFAPPSLTASRNAPVVPGLRSLLEFAHPACALVGFGFWMGYTFVHYRTLGWIGFGLVALTATLGLSWFAANARTARHQPGTGLRPAGQRPSFNGRLAAVHGGAAAVTVLAALAALVLRA